MNRSTRPPIERIYWIDARLRERRYPNARKVAEHFEIAQRTVYRDIQFMRNRLNAPIEFDPARNGYFYTRDNYVLPSIPLTEGEIVAALVARKVLHQYAGTPYEARLRNAFRKIAERLPDTVTSDLDEIDAVLTFNTGPARPVDLTIYECFANAVTDRRRVRMVYYTASRDEETERDVDVYHLHNYRGDWFLIAFDHLRGEIRDFALNRVRVATVTNEQFTIPSDFDAATYLRQAFGVERGGEPTEVRIRFDSYQARWIREREWHPTQRIEELGDKGLTLTFTVTGLDEVKRWVFQYGSHAKVLDPPELRSVVVEDLRRAIHLYESDSETEL